MHRYLYRRDMGKEREIKDITDTTKELEDYYRNFHNQCKEEDVYYNLEFKVPKVRGYEQHHPATARLAIDDGAAQIDTMNLHINVRPRNNSSTAYEQAERLRRFYIGLWHRTQKTRGLVLAHTGKLFLLYGLAFLKVVYDRDLWADRPEQKEESDEAFKERMDTWREERRLDFPVIITALNPQCVMPDPSMSGAQFVVEKYKRKAGEVKDRYPDWAVSPRALDEDVEWLELWDDEFVSYLADGKEVLLNVPHNYGFIPYVWGDPALGYLSSEGVAEDRYRGLNHPVHDDYRLQARLINQMEAILRSGAWGNYYLSGREDQKHDLVLAQKAWEFAPGFMNILAIEGAKVERLNPVAISPEIFGLYADVSQRIQSATVMPVIKGEVPSGPASGYKTAVLAGLARQKYDRIIATLGMMCEEVNARAAMLIEKVIQDDVTVWGSVGAETFDISVGPKDIKGYTQSEVKLKSVAPEEEERMAMLGARLSQQGLISTRYWATKYGGVENPIDDQTQIMIERILQSPEIMQMMTAAFMQTQRMQEEIEMRAKGGNLGGLGNQGIPPSPVGPRPYEPNRQAPMGQPERREQPGTLERLDLTSRQVGRGGPAGQQMYPWGQ